MVMSAYIGCTTAAALADPMMAGRTRWPEVRAADRSNRGLIAGPGRRPVRAARAAGRDPGIVGALTSFNASGQRGHEHGK